MCELHVMWCCGLLSLVYGSYDGYSYERERERESTRPREFGYAEARVSWGRLSASPVRLGPYRFYEKQARRSNGRICSRWFPSIAFTESELTSPELGTLRSKYLLALDPKEAALVAAV